MKKDRTFSLFFSVEQVNDDTRVVKAFLIKGASEQDRLEKARQIIKDEILPRWVCGCYSGENELAVILTRDPSYLWAMSFKEAKERAEVDGETIVGLQLR